MTSAPGETAGGAGHGSRGPGVTWGYSSAPVYSSLEPHQGTASVLPCSGQSGCCPTPEPRQGCILRIPAWRGCWQCHGTVTCHHDWQLARGRWGLGWVQTKRVRAPENPQILPRHFLNVGKRRCSITVLGQGDRREEPAVTDQGTALRLSPMPGSAFQHSQSTHK